MNKIISVTDTMKLKYVKEGVAFIFVGIVNIITELLNVTGAIGIFLQLLNVVLAATAVFLCAKSVLIKKEDFDEMAEENYYKAKARARDTGILTLMIMVYGSCTIYSIAKYFNLNLAILELSPVQLLVNMLFIYIGVNNLTVGKEFAALEEE